MPSILFGAKDRVNLHRRVNQVKKSYKDRFFQTFKKVAFSAILCCY